MVHKLGAPWVVDGWSHWSFRSSNSPFWSNSTYQIRQYLPASTSIHHQLFYFLSIRQLFVPLIFSPKRRLNPAGWWTRLGGDILGQRWRSCQHGREWTSDESAYPWREDLLDHSYSALPLFPKKNNICFTLGLTYFLSSL